MSKTLLIVFVKNIKLGKVKTRLAISVGDEAAFQVYKHLVEITERETVKVNSDLHIYFSDAIVEEKWRKKTKLIQKGNDLGEKMQNAFKNGFSEGYEKIVLIGSDLPDISEKIIQRGFEVLKNHEVVFGPAEDGGYYLLGMTEPHYSIFKNKQWSTEGLLKTTLLELEKNKTNIALLQTLNDIDTIDDLKKSSIASHFTDL